MGTNALNTPKSKCGPQNQTKSNFFSNSVSLVFFITLAARKNAQAVVFSLNFNFVFPRKNDIFDLTFRLQLGWKSAIFIRFAFRNCWAQKSCNTTSFVAENAYCSRDIYLQFLDLRFSSKRDECEGFTRREELVLCACFPRAQKLRKKKECMFKGT